MIRDALTVLEQRVWSYMAGITAKAKDPDPYDLKRDHTERVRGHIRAIADSLCLGQGAKAIAEAAALVHDLGRFPQFMQFATFSDALSKNHAALGAGVICREKLLERFSRPDKQQILRAVALHNLPVLPQGLPRDLDCLSRMLRDADKMDIFKVMTDLYAGPDRGPNYITHHFTDDGRISPELTESLLAGKGIPYRRVASLNDLKLFQMSWIFDMNFPAALAHMLSQGMVQQIIGSMPQNPALSGLEIHLVRYMEKRMAA